MHQNLTLASMQAADKAALTPFLSERFVKRGEILTAQGARVDDVYFPTSAYLANTVTFRDGRSAETFVLGADGVSGLAPFLADSPCAWAVEVRASGNVIRVPAAALRRQVEESPGLRQLLLNLTSDYQTQAALGVACASLHAIAPRLAKFILLASDRAGIEELHLTQEDLATLLGVQRTTVNAAALELRKAATITYSRGVIRITNRDQLTRTACECYALQRASAAKDDILPAASK